MQRIVTLSVQEKDTPCQLYWKKFDFATIVKVKIPSVEFVLSLELNFKRLQPLFAILTAD